MVVKIGMIGCGKMAKAHLGAAENLKDRMKFYAFADVDIERAKELADKMGSNIYESDYKEIFDDVDAVILALPHDLHYQVTKDCIEAGVHTLVEKPLALNKKECEELIRLDKSPDPVLMVGYVMRHDPLWQEMGRLIKEEVYGKAFQVSIWTEQYTDTSRGEWIGKADKLGGGQLFSHGCHYVDLLLDWMGKPVSGTHLGTNLGTPWMEREGTSNMAIKFADGAMGYHMGTWGARGSRLGYAVHAHCTEGMLELNHKERKITLIRDKTGGDLPALDAVMDKSEIVSPTEAVIYENNKGGKHVAEQLDSFLGCIEKKKAPSVSAAASMPSLNTIWALYEAEEKGVVADLSDIN